LIFFEAFLKSVTTTIGLPSALKVAAVVRASYKLQSRKILFCDATIYAPQKVAGRLRFWGKISYFNTRYHEEINEAATAANIGHQLIQ